MSSHWAENTLTFSSWWQSLTVWEACKNSPGGSSPAAADIFLLPLEDPIPHLSVEQRLIMRLDWHLNGVTLPSLECPVCFSNTFILIKAVQPAAAVHSETCYSLTFGKIRHFPFWHLPTLVAWHWLSLYFLFFFLCFCVRPAALENLWFNSAGVCKPGKWDNK